MNDSPPPLGTTPSGLRFQLYGMMFLQYFIQGSYLPVISAYLQDGLGFGSREIGMFGAALALGPLVAPFVVGQLVDRLFATQHVLFVCHLLGGILMVVLYGLTEFLPILILGALYSTLYVPTMMLTNSLAFHHLADREREFPLVRVWGTIGFVLPAWCIEPFYLSHFEGDALDTARGIVLITAGVSGLLMAFYCLTLPHTPPAKTATSDFAPAKVMGLLFRRNFAVLVGVSVLIAIVHQYFFVWNSPYLRDFLDRLGIEGAAEQRISSLGQIAEIAVMVALGWSLKRLGFKITMLVGCLAYTLRFLLLAMAIRVEGGTAELIANGWFVTANGPGWLAMGLVGVGEALHGFCFGCFLASAYIYVDKVAPADLRGSMQTFYGTFIVGAGFVLGGLVAGQIGKIYEPTPGEHNWPSIWFAGAGLAAIATVAFAIFFPRDSQAGIDQRSDA